MMKRLHPLKKVIAINSNDSEAYRALAACLFMKGEYEKAANLFQTAKDKSLLESDQEGVRNSGRIIFLHFWYSKLGRARI